MAKDSLMRIASNEFLLSSEDTAFDMSLIRQCGNFLVVGAVPFSTFAKTYNRQFGFSVEANKRQ